MSTEELLRAGIAAVKAGETAHASKLLIQVVQADPNSELGWLWLGFCRTVSDQRAYCFRRVLAINPNNTEARRQLESLNKPATTPQPSQTPVSTPSKISHPPLTESYATTPPARVKPSPVSRLKKQPQNKRKPNNGIMIWIGGGLALLLCVATVGIILLGRIISTGNVAMNGIEPPNAIPTMTATAVVKPTPNYTPTFETSPCSFAAPSQAQVTCGFVTVPEDRSGDINDTIRIAVAVFHSTGNAPKSDPILYLQGGPGDKAIEWAIRVYPSIIAPLIVDRDFIVFDPRGVGLTKPTLDCDEFKQTYLSDIQGKLPDDQKMSYYEGALLTCKNDLLKMGVNLSAYTSAQMAADARDVITALKYQQANLYGISYGTRIAQLVMRDYSEVVRSAILDSVVPIEVKLFDQNTNEKEQAIHSVFANCQNDTACLSAYPDLESVYVSTIDQLNVQPVTVKIPIDQDTTIEQVVNGSTFSNTVTGMLRTPQTIAIIPQLIYRTHNGDNSILTVSTGYPIYAFGSISLGTYISVNCHDQIIAMEIKKLDEAIYKLCQVWDVAPLLPGENDPVISDIPTLIFAGEYDLVTPPAFAHQLAAHLTHNYIAEIPNQGHAPSATELSDCPTELISAFLQDPNTSPNFACIEENKTIEFSVPYNINTPLTLEPVTIDQYQIKALVPANWSAASFGFYNRNGLFGDVTQIGIQKADVTEDEWITWLTVNFRSNQGLDQPAIKHDQRQANGLKWNLYQATSHGYPVDIAFAKSGKQTLMVLLFSHTDEHEALYNTVFLPAIDSTTPSP